MHLEAQDMVCGERMSKYDRGENNINIKIILGWMINSDFMPEWDFMPRDDG
ncbi:MAG TPA: hypothetical protein VJC37_08710 [Planctomycetota bacterium]|nr:hypothetical protein [Planctomycetota bacterium]